MNLVYPDDIDQINIMFDRINIKGDGKILCEINDVITISNNGLIKLKSIPSLTTLKILKHHKLNAIISTNLNDRIIRYLESFTERNFEIIVIDDISHLPTIERIFHRNYESSGKPFTKIHYHGPIPTKVINFRKINHNIKEIVIPLLDNIDTVIKLNPNIKIIGIHGEAYHVNNSPLRLWKYLLSLINDNSTINFVLFFRKKYLKINDVNLNDLPNAMITLFN